MRRRGWREAEVQEAAGVRRGDGPAEAAHDAGSALMGAREQMCILATEDRYLGFGVDEQRIHGEAGVRRIVGVAGCHRMYKASRVDDKVEVRVAARIAP